jgi:hypothetical protein
VPARFRLTTALISAFLLTTAAGIGRTVESPASPEAFFGFRMGAPDRLVDWKGMVRYFAELDRVSDRIVVDTVGETTGGRPYLVAAISSPDTIAALAQARARHRRLADPRETTEAEALAIAREGKVVVLVGAGVHSTEIGSTQAMNELAWTLALDRSPQTERILRHVIVLLVPCENPDGLQQIVEWYRNNRGTPYEDSPPPELYHRYAGHDNNRDAYMLTQTETAHLARIMYREWLPEVYLDLHQMGPSRARIFLPPYRSPSNPNVDPLLWSEVNLLGQTMAAHVQGAGRTGVLWGETYTGFWQGANSTAPWWHNIVGLLSEVAGARLAGPVEQERADPAPGSLAQPTAKQDSDPGAVLIQPPSDTQYRMNYPEPWLGGSWTARDVVEYHLLATMGLLEGAANNHEMLSRNFYRMHQRTIARFSAGNPYAFIVPPRQRDPGAAAELVRLLEAGGAEIATARAAIVADGQTYEAGSTVVPLAQPFGRWIKDLLEPQTYPDVRPAPGAAPERPYDVTAWTLGMLLGVDVRQINRPFEVPSSRSSASNRVAASTIIGGGVNAVIAREANADLIVINRLLGADAHLSWTPSAIRLAGRDWPAGTVFAKDLPRRTLERATRQLHVTVETIDAWPESTLVPMRLPRVAIVEPWGGHIDAGWTRWVFDQHDLPYTRLRPPEMRSADLAHRFDAIVLPEIPIPQLLHGMQGPRVRPEYRGGLDEAGIVALRTFVDAGGTLVTFGNAAELAIDRLDMPLAVAARGDDIDATYCPGALLRIRLTPDHPVTFGMPGETDAMFVLNSGYVPSRGADGIVPLARYATEGLRRSGYLAGGNRLAGTLAAAEVAMGRGRVIVLGFRPQHRGQTWATFKLIFNALYYAAARGAQSPPATQMFEQ